jgi:hypothetical protein
MKWRFADSIESFDAWKSIQGIKTVSLEEYSLLEPLGRKGPLPESLILESCVHLSRWLVAASSCFRESCMLEEVRHFAFERGAGTGDVLSIAAEVLRRTESGLEVECKVTIRGQRCGCGRLMLSLVPLEEISIPEDVETLWRELYGEA